MGSEVDEEIQKSKKALMAISERDYMACFEDWKNRWPMCILSEGDYFKGYAIDLDI